MNKQESDILNALLLEPFINQRILAEVSGHSLGVVNRSLKELIKAGYLNEAISPTAKAVSEYKNKTPKRAMNCTPFVRQYGILFRKWGVFVCQRDNESTTELKR